MPTDPQSPDDVGALIRATAAEVSAPASLRAQVESMRDSRGPRRKPWVLWPPRLGLAMAGGVAAALAVVLVLALGGSTGGAPTVADAATAALRPALGAAPVPVASQPATLSAAIDGISFPAWDRRFGLRATGARTDRLHGRRAITVTYTGPGGGRVGYTIVSTPPLGVPGSARRITQDETAFAVLRTKGASVVTWRRAGHTCVLASRDLGPQRLIELAAWTGNGQLGGYNG